MWDHGVLGKLPLVDTECNDADKSDDESAQDISTGPWVRVATRLQCD